MLIPGTAFGFVLLLSVSGAIIWCIHIARNGGNVPQFRKMAGIEAIPEAIGRAAEMGKPVLYNPGIADLTGDAAAQTYAAMEVLGYVARLCAEYDTRIIVPIRQAQVLPIAEEVVRTSFLAKGKADHFNADDIRYISPFQFGYVSGVLGITVREQPAANILLGAFWSESPSYIEAASGVGSIQIGGTANLHQIQFLVAGCDYTLIGEELFAAGAYLSENPAKLGSIWGQDIGKTVAIALIVLGVLSKAMGSDIALTLMSR